MHQGTWSDKVPALRSLRSSRGHTKKLVDKEVSKIVTVCGECVMEEGNGRADLP